MKKYLSFLLIVFSLFLVGCKKVEILEEDETGTVMTEQSFDLKAIEDVSEIEALFNLQTSKRNWFDGLLEFFGLESKSVNEDMVDADIAAPGGPRMEFANDEAADSVGTTGGETSSTNVQVKGVDEADIIKNDNRYIYIINGLKISVIDSVDDSVKTIDLKDQFFPEEAYLKGDTLVVLGTLYKKVTYTPYGRDTTEPVTDEYYYYSTGSTVVSVIDVSNKSDMKIKRTVIYDDAYLVSSRMIDDNLYLVLNQYVRFDNREIVIPTYQDTVEGGQVEAPLSSIYIMKGYKGYYSYNIVSSLNIKTTEKINYEIYLGYFRNIYSSLNNLYVVNEIYTGYYEDEKFKIPELVVDNRYSTTFSNIYRFNIAEGKLTYKARTLIAGSIKDQFSMDEYEGIFRVAATVSTYEAVEDVPTIQGDVVISIFPSRMVNFKTESFVYTFDIADDKFEKLDSLGGIGVGETIYSVRFDKTLGYVVTFRQIDPLYKIDFSDPYNIVILGELKSPGVSDYLHLHGEAYIVGIGRGSESDTVGSLRGVKVSLFKVNGKELEEVDVYHFEGDYSYTPVTYNHLSLITLESKGLYIFPVTIYQYNENYSYGSYIAVVEVDDATETITLKGLIAKQEETAHRYYYDSPRAVVVNSKLYSIFDSEVVINALDDELTLLGGVSLEVIKLYGSYYGYRGSVSEDLIG